MKNSVYCQLLGAPQVCLNGNPIFFSFSKIDALLFYLVVNKNVSRDEIAGILWPDKPEDKAKKNLRNAIYQCNKALGDDYISSPNNSILLLNDKLDITSDVWEFTKDPANQLNLYQGELLKGFFLKGSEDFEFWLLKMRKTYEKLFVKECHKKIEHDIEKGLDLDVEKNIQKLITIDEYDERNYQLLMKYYQKNHQNGKVLEVYYQMSDFLNKELGISPGKDSREIYEKTLGIVNQKRNKTVSHTFFIGRNKEIEIMESTLHNFSIDQMQKSIVIKGDPGIGKSSLCNRVLSHVSQEFYVIKTQCYQAEKNQSLRPWKQVLDQISDIIKMESLIRPALWKAAVARFFPYFDEDFDDIKLLESQDSIDLNMLSQVIMEAIKKITSHKKMVIFIEDLQWLDNASYDLLTSILLHVNHYEAIFVFTLRNELNDNISSFLSTINTYNKLLMIKLEPFSIKETRMFLEKSLSPLKITDELLRDIYQHTEGNLFFLSEYTNLLKANANLDIMPVKIQDALRNRFLYLTNKEQAVANIVSFFYDGAPMHIVARVIKMEQLPLTDIVDSLINKNILQEHLREEQVVLNFTHVKLREFIYNNQTITKRRIVHGEIARELESALGSYKHDSLLYLKVAYHFRQARQELKALDYQLSYIQTYSEFYHELFPVYARQDINREDFGKMNKEYICDELNEIRVKLDQLYEQNKANEEYQLLAVKFLYLEGRYLIRCGEYKRGIENIRRVIVQAEKYNYVHYLVEAYKQMIYYYIQVGNAQEMFEYIEIALDVSMKSNNHESISILLRLKGLYFLMNGSLHMAERLFKESINTFTITEKSKNKYSINIAAAYNYLAEIRHIEGRYDDAIKLEHKAIYLCEDKGALSSLSVFYINIGIMLYAKQDLGHAKEYFLKAYELYEKLSSLWKRPQLDAYMALIYLSESNYPAVYEYIVSAEKYLDRFSNPQNIGTIYFAKAIIKQQLNSYKIKDKKLLKILDQESYYYYCKALENLSESREVFERNTLNAIFGNNTQLNHAT